MYVCVGGGGREGGEEWRRREEERSSGVERGEEGCKGRLVDGKFRVFDLFSSLSFFIFSNFSFSWFFIVVFFFNSFIFFWENRRKLQKFHVLSECSFWVYLVCLLESCFPLILGIKNEKKHEPPLHKQEEGPYLHLDLNLIRVNMFSSISFVLRVSRSSTQGRRRKAAPPEKEGGEGSTIHEGKSSPH